MLLRKPPMADYFDAAVAQMLRAAKGQVNAAEWTPVLEQHVKPRLDERDVVDMVMPVLHDVSASARSMAGHDRVKPLGELHHCAIVTCADRAVLATLRGRGRTHLQVEQVAYEHVVAAAPFTMAVKLDKVPAFELLLRDGSRRAFTFSNHLQYRHVDVARWRDRLVHRFQGWQPRFDGCAVVRWQRPEPMLVDRTAS